VADPAQIIAVDFEYCAHRVEQAEGQRRRSARLRRFSRFFADADSPDNIRAHHDYIQLHLDETSRSYWKAVIWPDAADRRVQEGCIVVACSAGSSATHLLARLQSRPAH
jgi:S-adenosylmethionine:diacylglycerol 3-amino-3-carboxypropyl transferase